MADFTIRPLITLEDFHAAEDVHRAAWDSADIDITPLHIMLTIARNGGVVLGAFAQERLVGFVLGFIGARGQLTADQLKHCSHEMGVLPHWQSRGVGYALKAAQRAAVLQQGLRLITWTYDPLESRNAHLNITRLGAVCSTYIRDYYGELRDGLNQGLATDRFQVDWWIASRHVATRLARQPKSRLEFHLSDDVPIINPVKWNDHDLPVCPDSISSALPDRFLVEFPAEFQTVKRMDPTLALAWRAHLRQLCEMAFANGFSVIDHVHEPGTRARSFYLLQNIESSENSLNA
jgi:predicted GNAT superfamily acetyltransferase